MYLCLRACRCETWSCAQDRHHLQTSCVVHPSSYTMAYFRGCKAAGARWRQRSSINYWGLGWLESYIHTAYSCFCCDPSEHSDSQRVYCTQLSFVTTYNCRTVELSNCRTRIPNPAIGYDREPVTCFLKIRLSPSFHLLFGLASGRFLESLSPPTLRCAQFLSPWRPRVQLVVTSPMSRLQQHAC